MNPFEEGYYAGLVNDRANPHSVWEAAWYAWHLGNQSGLTVHCATIEAVYLATINEPETIIN